MVLDVERNDSACTLYSACVLYSACALYKEVQDLLWRMFFFFRAIINHFTPKVDAWAAAHQQSSLTEEQVGNFTCIIGFFFPALCACMLLCQRVFVG